MESRSFLDLIFREARTHNEWLDQPVSEELVRQTYDLLRWGPTSANSSPARFVWVRSDAGKAKLASLAAGNNQAKIRQAPVTVIIGNDLDFAEKLPQLMPHAAEIMQKVFAEPVVRNATAMRNGSLQGAYLIVAARSLGLDCGPMSGFDNAAVDAAFFAGTQVKSNFICSIGYGNKAALFPRNQRLSFEEANRFA